MVINRRKINQVAFFQYKLNPVAKDKIKDNFDTLDTIQEQLLIQSDSKRIPVKYSD
jgi:hypothetical protein